MDSALGTPAAKYFEASADDFRRQANSNGWAFWRGVAVGFLAAFPVAYAAVAGAALPGIG